jgi:hypothetical protein
VNDPSENDYFELLKIIRFKIQIFIPMDTFQLVATLLKISLKISKTLLNKIINVLKEKYNLKKNI